MTETTVDQLIDARGIACPGPLMSLIGAIRQSQVGDLLEVWSTDAGSATDIPAWVAKARHELVGVTDHGDHTCFLVRKGEVSGDASTDRRPGRGRRRHPGRQPAGLPARPPRPGHRGRPDRHAPLPAGFLYAALGKATAGG